MAFWNRAPLDPAQEVAAKIHHLEKRDAVAVAWDHRFGAAGVLTVACAALVGMAAESVQALLKGSISQSDFIQLVTAFLGVLVMNRGLLAAARNIRRAESRGEASQVRDRLTMWGVMLIESVSFAFMLWLFEGKPDMWSVQGFLLLARAAIIPYSVVYLEMQREQPPDPVDIGVQVEIGQGLGVMADLVAQSHDRSVPTALKLASYRANATMTPAMADRLDRMTDAAQAYETYKQTGQVVLLDRHGQPLRTGASSAPPSVAPSPAQPPSDAPAQPDPPPSRPPTGPGTPRAKAKGKPKRAPVFQLIDDRRPASRQQRIERVAAFLATSPNASVRQVMEHLKAQGDTKLSASTVQGLMREVKASASTSGEAYAQ